MRYNLYNQGGTYMNITFTKIVLFCLLGHYLADFTLQGCLAQMKQKQWWKDTINKYNSEHIDGLSFGLFRKDWRTSLIAHGLYWSLVTFLPVILFTNANDAFLIGVVFINAFIHSLIDDMKANLHTINLRQDQLAHLIQITITLLLTHTFFPLK